MGQELACTMRRNGRTDAGKAYLETDHVLFRGEERLKITLKELKGVFVEAGVLRLEFRGGAAEFELGSAAEKWARKILNPPSRAGKLGLKAGSVVRLVGTFAEGFQEEVRAAGAVNAGARDKVDLLFFAADQTVDLGMVPKLAGQLKPDGGLWVVYPKSSKAIREIEVIDAGRSAGLKDTKVAGFSETLTALRFVVPVAERSKLKHAQW